MVYIVVAIVGAIGVAIAVALLLRRKPEKTYISSNFVKGGPPPSHKPLTYKLPPPKPKYQAPPPPPPPAPPPPRLSLEQRAELAAKVRRAARAAAPPPPPYRPPPPRPPRYPTRPYPRLYQLLNGDREAADRLVKNLLDTYPERSETWCYERAVMDLERDRR